RPTGTSRAPPGPSGRRPARTPAGGAPCPTTPPPKPEILGGWTGGPPVSLQITVPARWLFLLVTLHRSMTPPPGRDSAPCFAALVASSCSTRPNGVARSAGRVTGSPPMRIRLGLSADR